MGFVAVLPLWLDDHFEPKLFKKPPFAKPATSSLKESDNERLLLQRIAFQSH